MFNLPSSAALQGTYRARWIVPVCEPPLADGWIEWADGRILGLGRGTPPGPVRDLGDVALLPGLVNAHTHLEFSDLAAPLGVAGNPLPEWIAAVLRQRGGAAATPEAKAAAIAGGLAESAAAGVRLLAEIATPPWPLPEPPAAGLEWIAFAELLGLQAGRQQQTWEAAERLPAEPGSAGSWGLSPHAPYSTSEAFVQRAVDWSRRDRLPLAMHVAESPEEIALVEQGQGPFRRLLRAWGLWEAQRFPWSAGITGLLRQLARAHRALVVHGNYLTAPQISFLASQPQMSVVYCPRTHAYFGHPPHPVAALQRAGIRVALGTDSRASNPDLQLWNEVRFLAEQRPDLPPETLLRMATLDAADALGRADCGRLQVGARPGLIALPTTASDAAALWPALCNATPHVIV